MICISNPVSLYFLSSIYWSIWSYYRLPLLAWNITFLLSCFLTSFPGFITIFVSSSDPFILAQLSSLLWIVHLLNLRALVLAVLCVESSTPPTRPHTWLCFTSFRSWLKWYFCISLLVKIANHPHTHPLFKIESQTNHITHSLPYPPFWLYFSPYHFYFSYLCIVCLFSHIVSLMRTEIGPISFTVVSPTPITRVAHSEWTNSWFFINHPCVDGTQAVFPHM